VNKFLAIWAATLAATGWVHSARAEDPPVPDLVRALKDADPERRAGAAWALAGREEPGDEATAALRAALADKSRAVRARAAVALCRAGKPDIGAVLPGLMIARNDPEEAVRATADEIWTGTGPGVRAAMPFVKRSLTAGSDPQAQPKAVEALSKPGLEAVPAILDALAEERAAGQPGVVYSRRVLPRSRPYPTPSGNRFHDTAIQALAKMGAAVVPTLDEALGDRAPTIRESAATALGRLGAEAKPAVPTLIGLFKDRDPAVRLRAAEAVGQLGPTLPETVPALTAALGHKDPVVRQSAVTALERLKPTPSAVADALGQALDDPEPTVRVKAAEVLLRADAPPAAALATLTEELRGRDPGTRSQAALLLQNGGARARPAVPALRELTADRDRMTRIYACQALAKLGGPEAETAGAVLRGLLTEDDAAVRTLAAATLWDLGAVREALPVLVAALGSNDQTAINTANQVLQRINTTGTQAKELVPALADALADDNAAARNQVLNILQRLGQSARPAAPAVARLLRAGDENVRQQALNTLRSIGGATKDAVPDLVEALRSSNPGVRSQVAEMIRQLGPDAKAAVPALKDLLKDTAPDNRMLALRVLHHVSPNDLKDAGPALTELIKSKDLNVRTQAFYLVSELGPQAIQATLPVILESLKSSDQQLRTMAASALSRIENAGSMPQVQAALREAIKASDPETRFQVVNLLERNPQEERPHIVAAMTELLKHEKPLVRLRAAEILTRHGAENRAAALPVFREALKDTEPNTRLNAARNLLQASRPGGPPDTAPSPAMADDQKAAVAVIADILRSGPTNLRMNAVHALQTMDDPALLKAAADGLKETLADSQPLNRMQAALLLTRLDGAHREAGIKALVDLARDRQPPQQSVRFQAMQSLRSLGADGEKAIVPILVDELKDPATRVQAAGELAQFGREASKAAVPALKDMLTDTDAETRLQAAQALVRIGGKEEVTAAAAVLSALLTEEQRPNVKSMAASALRQLGPEYARLIRPVYREMLKDPQSSQRLTAARQLLQEGDEDRKLVVPVLRELLKAGQPYERTQAAQLLVQADPDRADEAVAALRGMIQDRQTRQAAVSALAGMGPDHAAVAVPILREMLRDADISSRHQAINTLGQLGPAAKDALPELAELLTERQYGFMVANTLGRIGGDAVPALVKALESGDQQTQRAAVQALGQIGPDAAAAVPTLLKMLTAPDRSGSRQMVQFALQRIGPAVAPELAKLLIAEETAVRRAAAEALQRFGGDARSALPALEKAAADEDLIVRRVAALTAFRAGSRSESVVRVLADGLKSDDVNLRREATQLFAGFWPLPDPVLDGLKRSLDDTDGMVRVNAAAALARSDAAAEDAAPVLVAALKEPALSRTAVYAISADGVKPAILTAAVPGLREFLKDPRVRQDGLAAGRAGLGLVRAGAPDAIELLIKAVNTTRPPGSPMVILQALTECGPDGVAALKKLADHSDRNVRHAALDHLGQLARRDAKLIPVLATRLKDTEPAVRYRVLTALAAAGPNARSAAGEVAALLRDPDPTVRQEAAVAIADIGGTTGREEALKVLQEALRTAGPQITSARAVEAIGQFGEDAAAAVPALVKLVGRPSPYSRTAAIVALGGIGKPAREAVPALKAVLKSRDRTNKPHAAVALWRISGEAAGLIPALTAAIDEPAMRRPTAPRPGPFFPPPEFAQPPVPGMPRQVTYFYPISTRPNSEALVAVIRTLGEIGPDAKPATAALKRAASDADQEVAKAAADALKRIE